MRTKLFKIAQAATLGLAITFTLSCSEHGGGDDGGNPSSSSGTSSSSGAALSSSQGNDIVFGSFIDARDGKEYRTVVIGTQIWIAENLNYVASGSVCYAESISHVSADSIAAKNCTTYGRLYNWTTAMALDTSCNSKFCGSQINAKHRGICPSGWHIPSNAEWDKLMRYVDGNTDTTDSPYNSPTAGWFLKANIGWTLGNHANNDANGEDKYGFAALPGGIYELYYDYHFRGIGLGGHWWSSSEIDNEKYANDRNEKYAHDRYISAGLFSRFDYDNKNSFLSVRCLQDSLIPSSSSNLVQSGVVYGTPVPYEGETYQTVIIGITYVNNSTQTWFQRNLNYAVEGSKCYGEDPANCATYGRLYDWATAMALPSSCNSSDCSSQIGTKHRGICPSGWHISSKDEWEKLIKSWENSFNYMSVAGFKLKSTSGWNGGGGQDTYGFSALPGGYGGFDGGFIDVGYHGYWWAADNNYHHDTSASDYYKISYDRRNVIDHSDYKHNLLSVRCVED